MARFLKPVERMLVEPFVWRIGWLVSASRLGVAFQLGRWVAPHLVGWDGSSDMFGLLSAIGLLWMYEHRNIEGKYDRLREMITRPFSGL